MMQVQTNSPAQTSKISFSLYEDEHLIMTSFNMIGYKDIDVLTMPWQEFWGKLVALPSNTPFKELVELRLRKIDKNTSPEMRKMINNSQVKYDHYGNLLYTKRSIENTIANILSR